MTSDGETAWAWADVKNDPVVYRPPGTPGYTAGDFNAAEALLVWRREAVAVKYDLKGKDKAQVCDTRRLHYVSADGSVRTASEPSHRLSELAAKQEPVWALVWAALGDESLQHSALRRNQTGRWSEDVVLARHGELAIGSDTLTADLVSFTAANDLAVAAGAARRFALCDGLDVETD